MQIKDHYKTLGLPPSATHEEIRKAYRRLAQQYHPDKNNDDRYASAQFAAIKEAYETLTDTNKRHEYLQHRWYAQSTGKWKASELITPITILQQLLTLERNIATTDIHRLNELKYTEQLEQLLDSEAIETLNEFDDEAVNEKIVELGLKCCSFLRLESAEIVLIQIEKVNNNAKNLVNKFRKDQRRKESWESKKLLLVLLTVIVICALIYFITVS